MGGMATSTENARTERRWLTRAAVILVALIVVVCAAVWINARSAEDQRVDQLSCALSGQTDC